MDWEKHMKEIKDEVTALAKVTKKADLEKRFFRDFGCINFLDDAAMHEVELASEYHRRHMKVLPELHDEHVETPWRSYEKTVCKCGFSKACDSSD